MNKVEMVEAVAEKAGLSKADAKRAIDAIFDAEGGVIAGALASGNSVALSGFGTFEAKQREARMGRNPATGAQIQIGPSRNPAFKAGAALKRTVKV